MDSCHIFNFLFGTRKATTELSKCFTSLNNPADKSNKDSESEQQTRAQTATSVTGRATRFAERLKSSWQAASSGSDNALDISQKFKFSSSAPSSPLKQLQMRINASFAPQENSSESKPSSANYLLDEEDYVEEDCAEDDADNVTPTASEQRPLSACGHCDSEPTKVCGTFHAKLVESLNDDDENDKNETATPSGRQVESQQAKRVVLYDDSNGLSESGCNDADNKYVGSVLAEVYEIGLTEHLANRSQQVEPRAQFMRRVSSITTSNQNDDDDDQTDNEKENDKSVVIERAKVKNLVQSFESSTSTPEVDLNDWSTGANVRRKVSVDVRSPIATPSKRPKPITIVKPMPPKTPPKTNKAKCLNHQLTLHKPAKIEQLFHDEKFLNRFFTHLEPLDRCVAAQVCKQWRKVLYSDHSYWKNVVGMIDYTHLRREHLVECILNTLQTAKLKHQRSLESDNRTTQVQYNRCSTGKSNYNNNNNNNNAMIRSSGNRFLPSEVMQSYNYIGRHSSDTLDQLTSNCFDYIHQEDVWRIQELCNRYTTDRNRFGQHQHSINNSTNSWASSRQQTSSSINMTSADTFTNENNDTNNQTSGQHAPKSASIPSQISSTLSSVSLSSLLSPLSESSRIDSIREKLYLSIDDRGFDSICLFGATDDDIEDLIVKTGSVTHQRILTARLNNCCVTDRGLETFLTNFNRIEELELSGCNEISNLIDLKALASLRRLEISDCINIADGVAQKLSHIFHLLETFIIQSYHLTDAFFEYMCINTKTAQLKHLELPNCKEITNQSLFTISKHFSQLEVLSVSGSTKITDDGIEVLAEQAKYLKSLNLSWCNKITNAALECIACDLGSTLTDLILDR